MYLYDIFLVGNPDFESFSKGGWEDSWRNDNGEMPVPEWSEEVAAVWRDGTQFYSPEEWYRNLDILFNWRAEWGMQEMVEKAPIRIDQSAYEMCSAETYDQVEQYAGIIYGLSTSNVIEMYYPGLDDTLPWLDQQYA